MDHVVRIVHVGGAALELRCTCGKFEHRLGVEPPVYLAIQAMWEHIDAQS